MEISRVDYCGKGLTPGAFDVFVNPFGSAFPKQEWPQLLDFLVAGGNWVNLGGVPVAVPVSGNPGSWRPEVRQTAYHKELGITQAFPVDVLGMTSYRANSAIGWAAKLVGEFSTETVYELYYRFTATREFPTEDGSSGARDAVVQPLVSVLNDDGRSVAVPFVRIDRLRTGGIEVVGTPSARCGTHRHAEPTA